MQRFHTNEKTIKQYQEEYDEDFYNQKMKQVTDNIGKLIRKLFKVGNTSWATEVLFVERCLDLLKSKQKIPTMIAIIFCKITLC